MEAFQYGRPVICSDIGGMSEKVTDGVNGLHFRTARPRAPREVHAARRGDAGPVGRAAAPASRPSSRDWTAEDHVETLTGDLRPARWPAPGGGRGRRRDARGAWPVPKQRLLYISSNHPAITPGRPRVLHARPLRGVPRLGRVRADLHRARRAALHRGRRCYHGWSPFAHRVERRPQPVPVLHEHVRGPVGLRPAVRQVDEQGGADALLRGLPAARSSRTSSTSSTRSSSATTCCA